MIIAWDCETHLFGPGRMAPPVVCLSWATSDGASGLEVGPAPIRGWLHAALGEARRGRALLVGHVVAYDAACILASFPEVWGKLWSAYRSDRVTCTMIREKLLDIAEGEFGGGWGKGGKWVKHGYSMQDIAARRLGLEIAKGEDTWRTRYAELDGVPKDQWPQEAVDYAVKDAEITLAIYLDQEKRGKVPTQFEDTRADLALRLMSVWGVETDQHQVASVWESTTKRMLELAGPLVESGLARGMSSGGAHEAPTLSTSLVAIREAVTAHYPGGDPPRTEKTDAVKTGKDVIRLCPYEPLQQLVEFNALRKAANTYLAKYFEPVIHASFYAVGAASDRTSCRNPNMQNQPRLPGVRECFHARDGYLFLACDFDAQEMRTLAQSCLDVVGQSRLAERFRADRHFDPHLEFAAGLLGITVEEAKARKAEGDPEIKHTRQLSKCFHPDTEILTRGRGWMKIGELTYQDEVAAAYPGRQGDCFLTWERPTALTTRESPGELIHLKNENIDLRVTEDHRMLGFIANGEPRVVAPLHLKSVRRWANAGVLGEGEVAGLRYLSDVLLRLAVATQADGSYSSKGIRFGFSKTRKIERLRGLLGLVDGDWSESTAGRVTSFYVHRGLAAKIRALLDPDKTMPWKWVSYPLHFRALILEEAALWDASFIGKGKRSYSYSSTKRKNLEVLQTIAAISGRKTHLYEAPSTGSTHLPCHKLRVSDRAYSRGGALRAVKVPYSGPVVCLSVPSSFVLVRDGGVPVITGQCANFGLPGGMGAATFIPYAAGYGITLTPGEAADLKEAWLRQWPEMKLYFAHGASVAGQAGVGTVTIPRSGFVRGGCGYCDTLNTYFQTLAAHASKAALWSVSQACYNDTQSPLYGSRPVLFVHDEIIAEVPEARGHECAAALERLMVDAMEKWTPDVPAAASATLMKNWSKAAEQTYSAGRLVAWDGEE